jgi:precorrin-6B C5,15-methyltransferase / cobalt-precorrin-6B C5,C15-methyltransferase
MSVDALTTNNSVPAPWLSIVGIGADGLPSLSAPARHAIERATLLAGGARQLALVAPLVRGETLVWPSPLSAGIAQVIAHRGRSTCVLASGDPFFYGIGATLAPQLAPGEFVCYPQPSSLSLAASRLGWALQDTDIVSLHGRDLHAVIRYLQPGRRVLTLSWDQHTAAQLARLLVARGLGAACMHVLEVLGGEQERVRSCRADSFDLRDVADLNVVALELPVDTRAFRIPVRASLPDSAFEHDGQLTKQDIRALTLSALAPFPGARLWDIGAGAGSIAIEWMLSHPACRANAVERDPVRCARILRNASALGVPTLELTQAVAPDGLAALPTPDAIFIGGGGAERALFERCWSALHSGGRLVINSVSLETEASLLSLHASHGGELRRFSIESAGKLGTMTGWRPAMPVVQWRIEKS